MTLLLCAVLPGAALLGCGPPSQQHKAVEKVQGLGGKVLRKEGRLIMVDLAGSRATDADLPVIAEVASIQKLYLNGSITDAGLAHLAAMPNLEEIDLQNTQVTDAGLEHLKKLPKLARLYTHGSQVTEDGLAAFEAAMPGVTVERFPIGRPL